MEQETTLGWAMMISFTLLGFFIGLNFAYGESLAGMILGFIIVVFCSTKCMELARKIEKSPTIGFLVGFWAGLLGLAGYWIYYKIKS